MFQPDKTTVARVWEGFCLSMAPLGNSYDLISIITNIKNIFSLTSHTSLNLPRLQKAWPSQLQTESQLQTPLSFHGRSPSSTHVLHVLHLPSLPLKLVHKSQLLLNFMATFKATFSSRGFTRESSASSGPSVFLFYLLCWLLFPNRFACRISLVWEWRDQEDQVDWWLLLQTLDWKMRCPSALVVTPLFCPLQHENLHYFLFLGSKHPTRPWIQCRACNLWLFRRPVLHFFNFHPHTCSIVQGLLHW